MEKFVRTQQFIFNDNFTKKEQTWFSTFLIFRYWQIHSLLNMSEVLNLTMFIKEVRDFSCLVKNVSLFSDLCKDHTKICSDILD